jgi:aldose 1-epimerase
VQHDSSARIVALTAGDCTLEISPALGSAWTSLSWRGRPVLRPTPAAAMDEGNVRLTACYPLVPYSNRIAHAQLHHGHRDYQLARNFGDHPHAIHGVGWQRRWTVTARAADRVVLELTHAADDDTARAAWPWPFRAIHAVALHAHDGSTGLTATLTIESRADEPFPFGLGWHPFYPRDDATRLGFRAAKVWRNDATVLPIEHVAIPAEWSFATPRAVDVSLDQVFTGWSGVATLEQPSLGYRATLRADRACDRLVVYVPPGRDYLAVEPVSHDTDAFNRSAAGAGDTGTRVLPPGAAFSCTMRLDVAPLA